MKDTIRSRGTKSVGNQTHTNVLNFIDMQSKSLLIAMAAFAVTATGVHAYTGPKLFEKAGLSGEQISAFATAKELRETGNIVAARDVLLEAGIDDEVLLKVQQVTREHKAAIEAAILDENYEAFAEAVLGTSFAHRTVTENDFRRLVDAHKHHDRAEVLGQRKFNDQHRVQLTDEQREALTVARQANDRETVNAILAEAGITRPYRH